MDAAILIGQQSQQGCFEPEVKMSISRVYMIIMHIIQQSVVLV